MKRIFHDFSGNRGLAHIMLCEIKGQIMLHDDNAPICGYVLTWWILENPEHDSERFYGVEVGN